MADFQKFRGLRRVAATAGRWLSWLAVLVALPAFFLNFPFVRDIVLDNPARARVTVFNEVPVYDGRRRVEGLRVMFRDGNLAAPPQRIMAARIRISNEGGASITPAMVAAADPLGVQVDAGRFVEVSRVTATTPHLRALAKPTLLNGKSLTLANSVILDPGDHVDIDVLVLASTSAHPVYSPLGKVAGQRAVGLLDLRYESRRQDLVEAIVGGSWKTQVVRLLFYSIVAFALLYLARALVAAFTNRRISKRGLIADELRSQFDMDDVAEARLAEIALGVYQYTGERNFASFLHSLGHLHPLGAGDEVVAQVDTTAGPVSAQRGSVTRFLKKTNAGRKGVHDLVQRFGLVSEKRVDPRFLDIAERVHDKVGGRSRRPFSGFPRR